MRQNSRTYINILAAVQEYDARKAKGKIQGKILICVANPDRAKVITSMIELMFPDYSDVLQINVLDEKKREQVHPTIATAIDSIDSVEPVFMAPNFYHEGWSGVIDDKPKCRCGKEIC